MRRIRYYSYGGPEVLTVEQADIPVPGPGQVLVRASAIGANFVDTKLRRGPSSGPIFDRPLPGRLTGDVVGTVEAVGPGVAVDQPASLVGRRVATLSEDAFAEYVVADLDWLAEVPSGLDVGAASMLPLGGPTALGALRAGRLAPGETVLVHAAAGGIGHLAVQLAKVLGAGRVIATAAGAAKLDFALDHGADVAIDYSADDWPDQVGKAAPDGVDVILDSIGGQTLLRGLDLLAPLGRTVVYGVASGDFREIPVTSLFALRSVVGFSLLAWRAADPEAGRRDVAEIAGHLAAGRLRTTVHACLPLDEAASAHRMFEERAHRGRILLLP
ncbi:quinone oxidoreductase family protein [Frankia sp. AgKG'84/4]|uniref:quinone oxidoreductase family protein n=1 Tax=Frankia sp. AgKG'84/4 TaxID=573490 RepID=UPI00200F5326|nr:zinc-binding dehydrogenase [Frankia sp. AgKG'84/4]MCL9792750.1 zinc-binding dehydrogenase [Frankia sp. AgKG'84/4]